MFCLYGTGSEIGWMGLHSDSLSFGFLLVPSAQGHYEGEFICAMRALVRASISSGEFLEGQECLLYRLLPFPNQAFGIWNCHEIRRGGKERHSDRSWRMETGYFEPGGNKGGGAVLVEAAGGLVFLSLEVKAAPDLTMPFFGGIEC
jgi:hypothetical protein